MNKKLKLKIAQPNQFAEENVPKKSQSVIKKKPVATKKKALVEKVPVVEEKESKMYVDFPPSKVETPDHKPTKITLIIQLMGLLNSLLPNRELLYSLTKLVKVFISVAFTLSAIYASCIIYSNIFEWLFNFLTKILKRLFEKASFYLPELVNSLIVQKILSFLPGIEVPVSMNTYKYLPDFVYNMWFATKVLWSSSIFNNLIVKFFFWLFAFSMIFRIFTHFIAYASTLPGSWAQKIRSALSVYMGAFFRRCFDVLKFFIELFLGTIKPGIGWLNLFWFFQNIKEKRILNSLSVGIDTMSVELENLFKINKSLEEQHDATSDETLFYDRIKIKRYIDNGAKSITQLKDELIKIRTWLNMIEDPTVFEEQHGMLRSMQAQFKEQEKLFNHLVGILGEGEGAPRSKSDKTTTNFGDIKDDKNKRSKSFSNREDEDLEEPDNTGKKQ